MFVRKCEETMLCRHEYDAHNAIFGWVKWSWTEHESAFITLLAATFRSEFDNRFIDKDWFCDENEVAGWTTSFESFEKPEPEDIEKMFTEMAEQALEVITVKPDDDDDDEWFKW